MVALRVELKEADLCVCVSIYYLLSQNEMSSAMELVSNLALESIEAIKIHILIHPIYSISACRSL